MEFSIPVRVYIEDTDAGGIVYYVNYLKYMERCRTELLRAARLDDELTITASTVKVARTYSILKQAVYCNDALLCAGEIKIACVSAGEVMRPAALPKDIHKKLKEHEARA